MSFGDGYPKNVHTPFQLFTALKAKMGGIPLLPPLLHTSLIMQVPVIPVLVILVPELGIEINLD